MEEPLVSHFSNHKIITQQSPSAHRKLFDYNLCRAPETGFSSFPFVDDNRCGFSGDWRLREALIHPHLSQPLAIFCAIFVCFSFSKQTFAASNPPLLTDRSLTSLPASSRILTGLTNVHIAGCYLVDNQLTYQQPSKFIVLVSFVLPERRYRKHSVFDSPFVSLPLHNGVYRTAKAEPSHIHRQQLYKQSEKCGKQGKKNKKKMSLPILAKKVKKLASMHILNIKLLLNGRGFSKFKKQYRLKGEMGQGGFGVVYKAVRISDDLPVAVKFIERRHVREWGKINDERLPMEICMLARCAKIPGVIRLLDWFSTPEGFLIVMERPSPCIDLFDFIHNQHLLDENVSRFLFRQIVQTTFDCADRKVLHRDLKDENVVIDLVTGETKLIDFGAATLLKKTRYHDFQGTRLYCPPEWFLHSVYLGREATIWSLGILLYNMVNGRLPFHNEKDICTAHLLGPLPFFTTLSPEVRDLIEKCVSFDPFARPTLEEVMKHPWMKMHTPDWMDLSISAGIRFPFLPSSSEDDEEEDYSSYPDEKCRLKSHESFIDREDDKNNHHIELINKTSKLGLTNANKKEMPKKNSRLESGMGSVGSDEDLRTNKIVQKAFDESRPSTSNNKEQLLLNGSHKNEKQGTASSYPKSGTFSVPARRNAKTSLLEPPDYASNKEMPCELFSQQKMDQRKGSSTLSYNYHAQPLSTLRKSELKNSFDSGTSSALNSPRNIPVNSNAFFPS
ncbi:protein kinase domain-containing protein [Ditylenchus destructor]|nr:protein kinase domain-containing protein [Ditylenchus destructor]